MQRSEARTLLEQLGVRPSKGRGQNFLCDDGAARMLVAASGVSSDDVVIEVGPGLGAITRQLAATCRRLIAVDIEPSFCEHIRNSISGIAADDIICADVRTVDVRSLLSGGEKAIVVSNVPYVLSSEVLYWLVSQRAVVARASLLLQQEFAERVAAPPGGKDYGAITVNTALYATARLGGTIAGDAFVPRAKVASRQLHLEFFEQPRVAVADEQLFQKLVKAAFSTRRKTLSNCLVREGLVASRDEMEQVAERVGISPSQRGETLSLEQYAALANCLSEQK